MRWKTLLFCLSLPLACFAQEPSVEILGVAVSKGMTKEHLSKVLPDIDCQDESEAFGPGNEYCSVSDGKPPGADGEILFTKGVVSRALTNWFFPEGATPYEVALMFNEVMTRLVGEGRAVCGKIEAWPESFTSSMHTPGATRFVFPQKVLTITLNRKRAFMREYLRVNPVPEEYEVYGAPHQGKEWCGYVKK